MSVRVVFYSCASENAALVRTKICDQVLRATWKTTAETVTMIKTAYKEHALSDRQVFRWHKAFLKGREEVDNEDRVGRPSTTTAADNVT